MKVTDRATLNVEPNSQMPLLLYKYPGEPFHLASYPDISHLLIHLSWSLDLLTFRLPVTSTSSSCHEVVF